jgi:hypothetical protein
MVYCCGFINRYLQIPSQRVFNKIDAVKSDFARQNGSLLAQKVPPHVVLSAFAD